MSAFLDELCSKIGEKYKKTNPRLVNDMRKFEVEAFSSGCVTIDAVSGFNGFLPKGHIVEIVGANTSGKTTICIQTCAQAQKKGANIFYIDAEGVFDVTYAKALGLDVDSGSFRLLQPTCGEEVSDFLDLVKSALDSSKRSSDAMVDIIIIDSVAALRSQEELDGNKRIGIHAAMWSKLSPKLKNLAMVHNLAIGLINQVRFAPDISGGFKPSGVLDSAQSSEGSENTTGGEALKYLYSVRWQFKGFKQIKEKRENPYTGEEEDVRIGNISGITTIKNKLAIPMVKSHVAIVYGKGTCDYYVLEDIMRAQGFITSQGSYIKYECLDKSLMPEGKAGYEGMIYTKDRFNTWFRSDAVQADVLKRFKMLVEGSDSTVLSAVEESELIFELDKDLEVLEL